MPHDATEAGRSDPAVSGPDVKADHGLAAPASMAEFLIADPGEHLAFTGERYTSGLEGDIRNEHYHRYLFALSLCAGRDVLDVASGEGYGAALLAQTARTVIGVEIDEVSVAFATRAYAADNLVFRAGSALALPLDDASIDAVICFETIEHLADHAMFLREVVRVLRPGGIFVVSTPDTRVYSDAPAYHNPFHLKELTRDGFAELLGSAFAEVRMYEQQVLAGSVLTVLDDVGGGTESFATSDGCRFRRQTRLPGAPYLVAVAAQTKLPLPAASVLHGLWTDAAAAPRPGTVPPTVPTTAPAPDAASLRAEVAELRRRLFDANLAATRTRHRLLEMDHERGFLRAMLTSARRLANTARADVVHAKMETERTQLRIDATQAEMQAELDALLQSRSWRFTLPLRRLRTWAVRVLR